MPLGHVPGRDRAWLSPIFGSRKFSRAIEFRLVRRWLADRDGLALDLAAGGGEFAEQIALAGHRVVAFDHDLAALQGGRQHCAGPIAWLAGDAGDLPFATGSFGVVLCNSALEHFANDERCLREMHRVMKPGAVLLLTVDSYPDRPTSWLRFIPPRFRRPEFAAVADVGPLVRPSHARRHSVVQVYSAVGLRTRLEACGFVVEDVRPYLNGVFSKAIYELHIVLNALDFYNRTSRRLFPLFFPFTFPSRSAKPGYGLAVRARKGEPA